MIRGIDVPTTVWSIAAVNSPSSVPAMTITFVRGLIWEMDSTPGATMAAISARSLSLFGLRIRRPQQPRRGRAAPDTSRSSCSGARCRKMLYIFSRPVRSSSLTMSSADGVR